MCTNCEQQQKVWPQWIRWYDHMWMVQGAEIRTRLCYVIRRLHSLSYFYWRCCVYEKQGTLCVVLDMCCNLHNFWTPAPNLQSKKSVFFLIIPPSPVLSFAISFLRPVVSEKQWDGQRGALPLYGTGAVTIVWKHQLPADRVAVVAVCVGRQ